VQSAHIFEATNASTTDFRDISKFILDLTTMFKKHHI